ncbi:MAG: hypothetical protein AAGB11_13825 [Pseudomonadota bacterium]
MTDAITAAIRERLIEAALTELRIPAVRVRPAVVKGFWPAIPKEPSERFAAQVGEEDKAKADRSDFHPVDEARKRDATPAEVTRHDECEEWIINHVRRQEDRRALLAWAMSRVCRFSFRGWCRRNGLAQTTGNWRVNSAINQIASVLGKEQKLLRENIYIETCSNGPENGSEVGKLDEQRPSPEASFWRAPGAVPKAPDEDDPDALKKSRQGVIDANERSRRRRIAMGLEPEVV